MTENRRVGFNYFESNLKMITKMTEILNAAGEQIQDPDLHIHIELRDDFGNVFGSWSDEIGSDCWYYQPTEAAS